MDKKFVIRRSDIANNVNVISEKVNGARIYAVLKGNGYGMELLPFAQCLFDNRIRHFAVTDLSDAILLKKDFDEAEVLLLTPCSSNDTMKEIVASNITATIDSLQSATELSKLAKESGKVVAVHIKIDTGMGRFGFKPEDTQQIKAVCALDYLNVEGIYTHLHSAFNKKSALSLKQYNTFVSVIDALSKSGIDIPIRHICNSTATFRFPDMHLTAVRVGSALIGRLPEVCGNTGLIKIGTFYAEISDIRTLPKGHNIGYAALYKTAKEKKIICVSAGYSDGVTVCKANDTFRFIDILRYMFNDFKLLFRPTPLYCKINGKTTTSIGRIGMTSFVLDGDNIDAKIGDYVEIPVNPLYLSSQIIREYE